MAGFFALLLRDSAIVDGTYIPRTPDSLYHARRILDAAVGERGFYQFDNRLHVPEGTWIPWPWAYDYLIAKATRVALWIKPDLEPMAFLTYVAPAWVTVNVALFLAATGALNLSIGMRFLATLFFALSPLTQVLHAAGQIDHHFIELTFILLNIWLGLSWFRQPDLLRWPVALGIALGVAQAFHNGLFLLQLLPLTCIFILWLRNEVPPRRTLFAFCLALLAATQLILLPSEPYRAGIFEFGLLSWFHFYVAFSTSAVVVFMALRTVSVRRLCALAILAVALSVPMLAQMLRGAVFVSGEFSIMGNIVEAQSPYTFGTQTYGLLGTASIYSWLVFLPPVFILVFLFQIITERRPVHLFYAITSVFGLALLLTQFRFHYYGVFALITAGLVITDRLRDRFGWHSGVVFAAAFAAMAMAYQPALRQSLFDVHAPGSDPEYANTWPLYMDLADSCAEDPGVVLAMSGDGNAVLYHTECSVIANNFILRPEDDAKINEATRLMVGTPRTIKEERPDIKYILIRASTFNNGEGIDPRFPLASQLLIDEQPPEGFERIKTVFLPTEPDEPRGVYARLYKVVRK